MTKCIVVVSALVFVLGVSFSYAAAPTRPDELAIVQDGKAVVKRVKTGGDRGPNVVIEAGLSEGELKKAVRDASGIICRSGARITGAVLKDAGKLEAICRAGGGVDNIDVAAASRKGVVVMNTPGGNTISTAEHAFALMLALARNIAPAYISMREGRWQKSIR